METLALERTVTELDHVRLLNVLRRDARSPVPPAQRRAIEDLLDNAALVPSREIAPDVVTMQTQVLLHDLPDGQRHTLTLCFPEQADAAMGLVSVLSPVGCALLGLRVGQVARWSTPAGEMRSAQVAAVSFQPEASGHYSM